jgi:hypothetical protein
MTFVRMGILIRSGRGLYRGRGLRRQEDDASDLTAASTYTPATVSHRGCGLPLARPILSSQVINTLSSRGPANPVHWVHCAARMKKYDEVQADLGGGGSLDLGGGGSDYNKININ